MTDKKNDEIKPIVPGVDDDLLKGFLSLITFRFIRESREEAAAEKEKVQNG